MIFTIHFGGFFPPIFGDSTLLNNVEGDGILMMLRSFFQKKKVDYDCAWYLDVCVCVIFVIVIGCHWYRMV